MKRVFYINWSIALLIIFSSCLLSCSRQARSTADLPYMLSNSIKVAVAPFTQPRDPYHLISGQIPENQGQIKHDELLALDRDLRDVLLQDSKRSYDFIPKQNLPRNWSAAHSSGQPSALSRWLAYGRQEGAKYLLVPQILDWHEREGSEAGVTNSAHIRAEFYLLNIEREGVQGRSIFEEKQVGLVENLLTVGDFMKRRGQWVTAEQLTVEGMRKAVKDLGL